MVNTVLSNEGVGKESVIYTRRFSTEEDSTRKSTWNVLVKEFLQQFVSANDVVVDVGAGAGEFITTINAKRKIAVDLSPHVQQLSEAGVEVLQVPASEFTKVLDAKADVIFMSNFLEHLPDKRVLLEVIEECRRGLAADGTLMILQPNIRYVGSSYWDYIDHHIALTEHSLVEALEICGFEIVKLIPRFLPYTAKSKLGRAVNGGRNSKLVSWYLKLPFLWRIFGQQTFVVARPMKPRSA